jgi:hypothetical protein
LIKFFDADGYTTKWQVDICGSCRRIGPILIKVSKSIEIACLNSGVRRIKFFDRGALARTESLDKRTRIALPSLRG